MRKILHHVLLSAFVLAALAVLPTAAPAASFSVPLGAVPAAGPALAAGGQVLWMERRGAADVLVAAGEGVAPHDVLTLPPAPAGHPRSVALGGDGARAVIAREASACTAPSAACQRAVEYRVWTVDLATAALSPVDVCLGETGCARCDARAYGPTRIPLLRDGVLALEGACEAVSGALDLATGAITRFDGEAYAVAGHYALVALHPAEYLSVPAVVDTRDGRRAARLADDPAFDTTKREDAIDADGTVASSDEDGVLLRGLDGRRARVAPGPWPEDRVNELEAGVALAGGRVFQHRVGATPDDVAAAVTVSGRDGAGRRTLQLGRTTGSWSFDGGRAAWVVQPCATPTLQVWDVAAAAPAAPPTPCVLPRVARGARVAFRAGRLGVPVSCPAEATQGCAGFVTLVPRAGDGIEPLSYTTPVRVPAGARRTAALKPVDTRRLRRWRGRSATVSVEGFGNVLQPERRVAATLARG